MKKVKIMLYSLLVLAAVGGTLAFKIKKYGPGLKCGSTTNSCPTPDNDHILTFTTGTAIAGVYCTDGTNTTICKPVTTEP